MRVITVAALVSLGVLVALGCGDDETETSTTTSSSTSSTTSSSGTGGTGGAAANCAAECAATACNDSTPDATCDDCIDATCDAEITACLTDAGGTCGAADCTQCGALLMCNECSDQLALDADGKALFDAILTCTCG
jgi:hypothetical protein